MKITDCKNKYIIRIGWSAKNVIRKRFQTIQQYTLQCSALSRKCVSAKIGKETMGRHTRARMDARRHKICMQKSEARQIAASNWKNFAAMEFEVAPTYTLK